jgi:hypothetical protein
MKELNIQYRASLSRALTVEDLDSNFRQLAEAYQELAAEFATYMQNHQRSAPNDKPQASVTESYQIFCDRKSFYLQQGDTKIKFTPMQCDSQGILHANNLKFQLTQIS